MSIIRRGYWRDLVDRWRSRREERRYGPLTHDYCEVCRQRLRVGQRVERIVGDIDFSSEYQAHSAVLATYCRKDAPA